MITFELGRMSKELSSFHLSASAWWSLFLTVSFQSPQTSLHIIPLSTPKRYLILNPHPGAEVGKRMRWKQKRWCQFWKMMSHYLIIKKKKRSNLVFAFTLRQNGCINMCTGKCHSCSLKVRNRVSLAVSQLRWLPEHEACEHTVHCNLWEGPAVLWGFESLV